MLDTSLRFLGFAELEADFQRLAKATSNKVVRDATLAGARVAQDRTRKSAPIRSGKLQKHIVAKRLRQRDTPGAAVAGVSVRRPKNSPAPFYWRFLELGTSNMTAKPFIRPTWDRSLPDIEGAVRSKLVQAIDQALLAR
ncbi:HK97 gp10 family phage protein [Pseudomonas poae]|nr:HK97 gp10 family phage protein [Pseudomonas poae]